MKPLSERDENSGLRHDWNPGFSVGMKPLSERDENNWFSKLALDKTNVT